MLDLASEVDDLWGELQPAVERVLRSGRFIGGPEVEGFEAEVAAFLGVRHAVGLNSGTDALVIALEALGLGPGAEVITTPFSFFATAEAIVRVGATPVFGDVDPVTLNLDPATVPPLIGPKTRALLPVHLFGLPVEMGRLAQLAAEHDLAIVEDAAQAFGATYRGACPGCEGRCGSFGERLAGRRVGALGDAAAFSFYPTKTLGAYGDAGLLATDDDGVAERARRLRTHGSRPNAKYVHDMLGHNSRLDALQAAVLRVKLPRVAEAEAARRQVAGRYRQALGDLQDVRLPPADPSHVFHQFTVQVPADRREAVEASLREHRVAFQRFYPLPLSAQPALDERATTPAAAAASERVLSLPVHPRLREQDVERAAEAIRGALSGARPTQRPGVSARRRD
jgi:dTDP-4-amino-4,6-dideoxygalactose transaminase